MKIEITVTSTLTDLDGVPVRVWNGVTEGGQEVLVFVQRLAVHKDQDQMAFERELEETMPPESIRRSLQQVFDLRHIL